MNGNIGRTYTVLVTVVGELVPTTDLLGKLIEAKLRDALPSDRRLVSVFADDVTHDVYSRPGSYEPENQVLDQAQNEHFSMRANP